LRCNSIKAHCLKSIPDTKVLPGRTPPSISGGRDVPWKLWILGCGDLNSPKKNKRERDREGERKRERKRERQRSRETKRERDRTREGGRERETWIARDSERERDRLRKKKNKKSSFNSMAIGLTC